MKTFIFSLFFLSTIAKLGFSQAVQNIDEEFYIGTEAEFPGGYGAMKKFISKNMVYPQDAIEKNLQGTVYVQFSVDTIGKIGNVKILEGLNNCESCNQEALRVVKSMPDWNPSVEGSKNVKTFFKIPITFELIVENQEDSLAITKRYDAHWAGFDIGTLILMSKGFNSSFENNPFWENNVGKSSSVNFNIFEYKLPIFRQYFGLTTGLGMAVSTIGFKDNYFLQHNQDSVFAIKDTIQSYRMNSLSAGYVTVPLLLEFSSKPKQKKSFYVAAGVVGGLRFTSSTTKTGKYSNGDRFQNVVRSKYNLNPITLDATIRAGYGLIGVYASYQLTSLFKNNKTVEILPFKVGLTLNIDFFKNQKSRFIFM